MIVVGQHIQLKISMLYMYRNLEIVFQGLKQETTLC